MTGNSLVGVDGYSKWAERGQIKSDKALYRNSELVQRNPLVTKANTVKVVLVESSNLKMERSGASNCSRDRYTMIWAKRQKNLRSSTRAPSGS